jgi:hypothetical protein
MNRTIARAIPFAMAAVASSIKVITADPLGAPDSVCTFYGRWPEVGGYAVCVGPVTVCTYRSETWGVSHSCDPI